MNIEKINTDGLNITELQEILNLQYSILNNTIEKEKKLQEEFDKITKDYDNKQTELAKNVLHQISQILELIPQTDRLITIGKETDNVVFTINKNITNSGRHYIALIEKGKPSLYYDMITKSFSTNLESFIEFSSNNIGYTYYDFSDLIDKLVEESDKIIEEVTKDAIEAITFKITSLNLSIDKLDRGISNFNKIIKPA